MSADLDATTTPDYITDIRPRDPWIKVLFHGLMTGCFSSDRKSYDVGMLETDEHTIQLNVWDSGNKYSQTLTSDSQAILRVNHKDSRNNLVKRFQIGSEFDRTVDPGASGDLRHDFRWLLDFEGRDLHGVKLHKNAGTLHPKFRLENGGVLLTLVRSVPILKNRRENGQPRTRLLGRIGQIVAAYVFLPDFPDGQHPAELMIDGESRYQFLPERRYEIVLRNDCADNADDCFDEGDMLDTTILNDAFRRPRGKEHFTLLLGVEGDSARKMMEKELANGIREECGFELGGLFDFLGEDKIMASRYNPCGKAFYGQSISLDLPRAT